MFVLTQVARIARPLGQADLVERLQPLVEAAGSPLAAKQMAGLLQEIAG